MIDDPGMAEALAPGIADAKAYLRIDGSQDDEEIGRLLEAAAEVAESFLSLTVLRREIRETLPVSGEWQRLARTPVVSISLVEGVPEEGTPFAMPVAAYGIDLDRIGDGWVRAIDPGAARKVRVTYSAGLAGAWATLPPMIRQGIVRLVAHFYAHRDGADGGAPPAAVAALWRPWRRMRLR